MIFEISNTFDYNLERVDNLLNVYKAATNGPGRKHTHSSDVLRASVVLLHATLEDYLRNLLLWKLPEATQDVLKKIPLKYDIDKSKHSFDFGDLFDHKEKTVDSVLRESIAFHLNAASFNDTREISNRLTQINCIVTPLISSTYSDLTEMIKRRHHIVHQADRNRSAGRGQQKYISLNHQSVVRWRKSVERFVTEVNKNYITP